MTRRAMKMPFAVRAGAAAVAVAVAVACAVGGVGAGAAAFVAREQVAFAEEAQFSVLAIKGLETAAEAAAELAAAERAAAEAEAAEAAAAAAAAAAETAEADAADPEADPEAEPATTGDGTAAPTGPYAEPTPVGGEGNKDNQVNTHQLPDSSFLYDTSLVELASATSYYDGQTVQITGEAIGDIIHAGTDGTHVWLTLASTSPDSDATVVVYLPSSATSIIDTLGEYGKTGTVLQVRGTFHLVCPDHEGVSDIHAENVNVVSPGTSSPDEFSWAALQPGALLLLLAGALLLAFHLLRQRLR